jgi:hypothetical protein
MAGQEPKAVKLVAAEPASIGSVYRFYAIGRVPAHATPGQVTLSVSATCGRIEAEGDDEFALPIDAT